MASDALLLLAHTRVDLTFWINKAKANGAGKVPVSLRITVHGTRAEVSTKIRCMPEKWDKVTKRLRLDDKRDTATSSLNTVLDDLEAKARLLGSDLRLAATPDNPLTAAQVRQALVPPKPKPIPCALQVLEAATLTYANLFTRASSTTALNALRRFVEPAKKLPLPHLTTALVNDFADWLLKQESPRAGVGYLTHLRALYGRACPKLENPFADSPARLKATASKPRYVLSREELHALRELELPAGRTSIARDIYLTQYYLHGSRVGVVLELTWDQVDWKAGRVRFKAEKGGGWQNVAIRPPLAAVLKRYYTGSGGLGFVFPVLPKNFAQQEPARRFMLRKAGNTYVWRGLQALSTLLNLPGQLHSHTARHTLATHTVQATKSFHLAKELLGHHSIAVTEKYVRAMLPEELDSGADAVYGS
jgi:integrase/recombinase XerD